MPSNAQIDDYVANPRHHFRGPFEVADSTMLKSRDKIRILESWKLDAQRLSESSDENMTGGEESDLRDVSKALLQVKAHESSSKPVANSRKPTARMAPTMRPQTASAIGVGAVVGAGAGAVLATAAAVPLALTLVQTTLVGAVTGGICSVFLRSSRRA